MLRLIDLLAVAVDDMRQGGDPRLPLELALVKVTRPQADLSRESLAHRVELLEERLAPRRRLGSRRGPMAPPVAGRTDEPAARGAQRVEERPPLELEQLQDAWQRSVLPAVQRALDPDRDAAAARRGPSALAGDTLTIEFAPAADFHRRQAEEPKNLGVLRDALYEVTGRKLAVATDARRGRRRAGRGRGGAARARTT